MTTNHTSTKPQACYLISAKGCPLSLGFWVQVHSLLVTCQNTKSVGNILYHLAQRYA